MHYSDLYATPSSVPESALDVMEQLDILHELDEVTTISEVNTT